MANADLQNSPIVLALKIHRLFVADPTGTLVGVISTSDVLRCLHRADTKH